MSRDQTFSPAMLPQRRVWRRLVSGSSNPEISGSVASDVGRRYKGQRRPVEDRQGAFRVCRVVVGRHDQPISDKADVAKVDQSGHPRGGHDVAVPVGVAGQQRCRWRRSAAGRCCPRCKSPLRPGAMSCPDAGRRQPVISGLPVFMNVAPSPMTGKTCEVDARSSVFSPRGRPSDSPTRPPPSHRSRPAPALLAGAAKLQDETGSCRCDRGHL